MIAITGASGQLGRQVIQKLLTTHPAHEIVAIVRRPDSVADLAAAGVQVRVADYNDQPALSRALAGVKKVLLISSSEIGQRVAQHQNVIEAARSSGVSQIVYTSLLHADSSPLGLADEHRQTEKLLAGSGLEVVLLRNGWYTENYLASVPAAIEHGILAGCAGDGLISPAPRADYAAAAAEVLRRDGQAGKVWELAGDNGWTLTQLAQEITRLSGKAVRYQDMSLEGFESALVSAGLPQPIAAMLADSDRGASQGGLFDDSHQLSQLLGRPTEPLAVSLRQHLA
ncbi:NAD(P)-dependent oxidoreductase [Salmonella enterica subsp. enterica serovar Choleraesuis]|nr:NAD(P)-dependent oxidoreductase [Salmonella enterica subsp. enterica serovar Choleraesuis]